jgi:regulator of protease activity HflC (stomatin/prohibitin superfamily)
MTMKITSEGFGDGQPIPAKYTCDGADLSPPLEWNQGVEVAGFAVWKVGDPDKASASFDFTNPAAAITVIGGNLKNVVESAIRHQVANMTMEDALRKRGTIILRLKEELAYIAEQWGLIIETVEIKNVRVLSAQLFTQMQARFRDATRLESEMSGLETDRQLAGHQLAQREEIAVKEREFQLRELERGTEVERVKIATEKALKEARLEGEADTVRVERALHDARAVLETARQEHRAALGVIDDDLKRRQIETANGENQTLALVKSLPDVAGSLQIRRFITFAVIPDGV